MSQVNQLYGWNRQSGYLFCGNSPPVSVKLNEAASGTASVRNGVPRCASDSVFFGVGLMQRAGAAVHLARHKGMCVDVEY